MRICILEGDLSRTGGTERMTSVLANALAPRHSVWVVSLRLRGEKPFFPLSPAVTHHPLPGRSIPAKIAALRRFLKAHRVERLIHVDIGTALYGIPAAWGTGVKTVTWEHSNFFNRWNSRAFPHIRRFAARQSDALVVLTEGDRSNYEANLRRCAPVSVIPNPIEPKDTPYRAHSVTLLSAGHLVPAKGFDRAVELAARLLPSRPGWRWVIRGEGPDRPRLEGLIRDEGLEGRVLLPGVTEDMDSEYQQAAFFVLTSEVEGLPLVLLEARAHGLPTVSFDVPTGPRQLIDHGVNGILIPPFDLDGMESALARLMDDGAERLRLSAAARRGLEAYDPAAFLTAWENLLKGV